MTLNNNKDEGEYTRDEIKVTRDEIEGMLDGMATVVDLSGENWELEAEASSIREKLAELKSLMDGKQRLFDQQEAKHTKVKDEAQLEQERQLANIFRGNRIANGQFEILTEMHRRYVKSKEVRSTPRTEFHIAGIARRLKISDSAVSARCRGLVKRKLLKSQGWSRGYYEYTKLGRAYMETQDVRYQKTIDEISRRRK